MFRHIVLMRMGADSEAERQNDLRALSEALLALPGSIPQIIDLSVGSNEVVRPGNWDLALTVDLKDAEDLEIYRSHPEHVKVGEFIAKVVADRCAVDFTI